MFQLGKQMLVVWALACLAKLVFAPCPDGSTLYGQEMATAERLQKPGWWPTKGVFARSDYLGPQACAQCHSSEAETQGKTPMAHAGGRAEDSAILRDHEPLSFHLGAYVYDLARAGSGTTFSVSDGTHSITVPLGWAFGEGEVGQTFLFQRGGTYYEGHLSFFPILSALDVTPGHPRSIPSDLEQALGRRVEADETQRCFGCHTTTSTIDGEFHPERLIPGVTCEACHGPGAKHVAAMRAGEMQEGLAAIVNPAGLSPADSVDFCGACHRTWADVEEAGLEGVSTLRFHPYRLENSRCWGKGDARLTCLACHDPHQPLVHDAGAYDDRCLRCHLRAPGDAPTAEHPGNACPRGTKDCVTCHMPKRMVPDTHTRFTDHWIAIDREGMH
jgi:hypothetical protein